MAIISFTSCQERFPKKFDDISGVYFNNRTSANALTDSLEVTFVYENADRIEIPVMMKLMGRVSRNPRNISIRVFSDNAEEGKDYILPQSSPVIGPGAVEAAYPVTLLRTAPLKDASKTIWLELSENEDLGLPVKGETNAAGTFVSAVRFRIIFSDMFTTAPAAWEKDLLGEFSQQKFELIVKVIEDLDRSAFNDPSKMTLSMSLFISTEMTRYVKKQVELKASGSQDYDKDAFDKISGEPLVFGKL